MAAQVCVKNTFLEFVEHAAMSTDDESHDATSSRRRVRPRAKSDSLVTNECDRHGSLTSVFCGIGAISLPHTAQTPLQACCDKLGGNCGVGLISISNSEEETTSTYAPDDATPRTNKTHLPSALGFSQDPADDKEASFVEQSDSESCTSGPACAMSASVMHVDAGHSKAEVVASRRRPARGSRALTRLLAEAAKTARSIRETEMARRQALRKQMNDNTPICSVDGPSMLRTEGMCTVEAVKQCDMTRLVSMPVGFSTFPGSTVVAAERSSPSTAGALGDSSIRPFEQRSQECDLRIMAKRSGGQSTVQRQRIMAKVAGLWPKLPDTLAASDIAPAAGDEVEALSNPIDLKTATTRTTVMMKNIPNNYTRSMLLELLNGHGFFARFDFVYLPIDFKRNLSLGYAFVNLCTPCDVEAFWHRFAGFRKWAFPSKKISEVAWSGPQQGLGPNIERYQNSPVMHVNVPDECKPVIFANGQRIAFPMSSKKVRAPRVRRHGFTANAVSASCADAKGQRASRHGIEMVDVDTIISGDEAAWL